VDRGWGWRRQSPERDYVFTAVDGLYFHHLVAVGIPIWTNLHFALFQTAGNLLKDRAFGLG
jgi:hypothetical protein